jgi:mitochondrial fission protein ELM1
VSSSSPDGAKDDLLVWYMTTGEPGTHGQARGLARELSAHAEERLIRVSRLWSLVPAALFRLSLFGISRIGGRLEPPWPDVLITCGRRSALAAMAVRRRSRAPMVTVHIQRPGDPAAFDVVVAMAHDDLAGANVLRIDTALHGLRAPALAEAAIASDRRFADLPRPWIGVLLGGSTRRTSFTVGDARRLADDLAALREDNGGSLLITPSRRTPAAVVDVLNARYAADPTVFLWAGSLPNPYMPILASADHLVVTSDSISMLSEALATKARVWVFNVPGGPRHARFVENLLAKGLVASLGGPAPPIRQSGIDSMPHIAAILRDLVEAKTGRTMARQDPDAP